VWSWTYNDANNRFNGIHCVNNSPGKSTLTAVSNSTGAVVSFECAAGATLNQSIPAGQAANFGVVIVPHGSGVRVDGVTWSVQQDGC
jgi:hypothetical protein